MKKLHMLQIEDSVYININQIVYYDNQVLLLDDGSTFSLDEEAFKKLQKLTDVVGVIKLDTVDSND